MRLEVHSGTVSWVIVNPALGWPIHRYTVPGPEGITSDYSTWFVNAYFLFPPFPLISDEIAKTAPTHLLLDFQSFQSFQSILHQSILYTPGHHLAPPDTCTLFHTIHIPQISNMSRLWSGEIQTISSPRRWGTICLSLFHVNWFAHLAFSTT